MKFQEEPTAMPNFLLLLVQAVPSSAQALDNGDAAVRAGAALQ